MIYYKGFSIWYNDLQKAWILQQGYNLISTFDTLKGAKISATIRNKSIN